MRERYVKCNIRASLAVAPTVAELELYGSRTIVSSSTANQFSSLPVPGTDFGPGGADKVRNSEIFRSTKFATRPARRIWPAKLGIDLVGIAR